MRFHLSAVAAIFFCLTIHVRAQSCGEISEPQSREDANIKQSAPLIFGAHTQVPRMRIRFLEAGSDQPLKTEVVKVHYRWRWWEYPYSEHLFGAWADSEDIVSCHPDKDGWIEVPAHELIPRGWYNGKYVRKPRFDRIEIVATTGNFARVSIPPDQIKQLEKHELVIHVEDGRKTTISWQPSSSP